MSRPRPSQGEAALLLHLRGQLLVRGRAAAPPSFRELAALLGISPAGVAFRVAGLERKGWIKPRKWKAARVLQLAEPFL